MKRVINKILLWSFSLVVLVGCENMLQVDSDQMVRVDQHDMSSDSLYSLFGILAELQKIADSYVIMGELRGDLLEIDENADMYLKEIYNFDNYSVDNPYVGKRSDYYTIINNCNYMINNIDTAKVIKAEKPFLKAGAAATAIKAWAYMQLVLNYGDAIYFDKPVLSIKESENIPAPIQMGELFPILINELLPYKDVEPYRVGTFGGFQRSELLFFSVPVILGDLYLWLGENENAANVYRDLIYRNSYTITDTYVNRREVVGTGETMEFTDHITSNWQMIFMSKASPEFITTLAVSNEYEYLSRLDSLFVNYQLGTDEGYLVTSASINTPLRPTQVAINYFDSTLYFHNYTDNKGTTYLTEYGDLRANGTFGNVMMSSSFSSDLDLDDYIYVSKYITINRGGNIDFGYSNIQEQAREANVIVPYRIPTIYLRYAEAVNRLGKPNLAMAVLKHGLKNQTLMNRQILKESDVPDPLPNYMDFKDVRFNENVGIHTRGAGYTERDTTFYVIKIDKPEPTLMDSILFVEDLIQKEAVLELSYEGNRYHDLMRFAMFRDDNSYLADKVAAKFTDSALRESVRTKLNDRSNWYVKFAD